MAMEVSACQWLLIRRPDAEIRSHPRLPVLEGRANTKRRATCRAEQHLALHRRESEDAEGHKRLHLVRPSPTPACMMNLLKISDCRINLKGISGSTDTSIAARMYGPGTAGDVQILESAAYMPVKNEIRQPQ